jgi:methionyl-tRNA formyltransferase
MIDTVVIAGKNDIACTSLEFVRLHPINVLALPNSTDGGIDTWQRSFKKYAIDRGVKIITLEQAYSIPNSIFISCEYDKIIKPKLFDRPDRLFNVHFSILPKYKGMYTSCLPILHGETKSGVTLHKMDAGIDTGDVIDQSTFDILENDVALDLYKKYTDCAKCIFEKNFHKLLTDDGYTTYEQGSLNSSYFSKNTLDFKNISVDYKKTANEIKNQIHAFSFEPYQLPKYGNTPIYCAKILKTKSVGKIKDVIEETSDYIIINTIDYDIKLYKTGQ